MFVLSQILLLLVELVPVMFSLYGILFRAWCPQNGPHFGPCISRNLSANRQRFL